METEDRGLVAWRCDCRWRTCQLLYTRSHCIVRDTQLVRSPLRTEQSSLAALPCRPGIEGQGAIPTGSTVIIMGQKKSWDWTGLSRYFQRMLLCISMGRPEPLSPPRPDRRARSKTVDSDNKKKKIGLGMWGAIWLTKTAKLNWPPNQPSIPLIREKSAVLTAITTFSLVDRYQCFGGTYRLHHQWYKFPTPWLLLSPWRHNRY
jgi:hypothetical protein